jgi:hypothetical protein
VLHALRSSLSLRPFSANSSARPTAIIVTTTLRDIEVRHDEVHSQHRQAKKRHWKRNDEERVKKRTVEDSASNKLSGIRVTNRTGVRQ